MRKRLLLAALVLALSGCKANRAAGEQVFEFNCYIRNAQTEHHKNVTYYSTTDGGGFRIYYLGKHEFSVYTPRLGESCGLEIAQ